MRLRHTLALVVLPGTMAVLVPWWIARAERMTPALPRSFGGWVLAVAGLIALVAGLALFLACFVRFDRDGRGTLAPWDPPDRLVVAGPYAYVRNPMISGVVLVLLGEALALRSAGHLAWTAAFFAINAVYIPLMEEPGLRRRFGAAYERYANHVPRLLPRLRPWRGDG